MVGSINYAKKDVKAITGRGGLDQGGEFLRSTEQGTTKSLAMLESHDMRIYDARAAANETTFSIDEHGFMIASLKTALPETLEVLLEEGETQIRQVLWPEVVELARRTVESDGRLPKYVFAIGTQKFTEDKSRGLLGSYSRQAHCDFSDAVFDGAWKMLAKRGVPEAEARRLDIMLVNAWRPFGQVVSDNPLTILDWTSVDPAQDVHGTPRGEPVRKGRIYPSTVVHNPAHRWMYLPDMGPEEVWLFKQADSRSRPGLAKHSFHTSFRLPGHGPSDRARRSIAVRLILAFEPMSQRSAL